MPRSRDACPKLTPRSLINPIASSLNSRVYFRRPIAASPVPCSHLNSVSTKPAAAQCETYLQMYLPHHRRVKKTLERKRTCRWGQRFVDQDLQANKHLVQT